MSPFQRFMAIRSLGGSTSQNTVDWAYAELLDGRDTPNLRILAGLCPPLDSWEVDHYLNATPDNLDWRLEDGAHFLRGYTLEIVRDILSGARPPVSASRDIYAICQQLDYPEELSHWLEVPDEWECETYHIAHSQREEIIKRKAQQTLDELLDV